MQRWVPNCSPLFCPEKAWKSSFACHLHCGLCAPWTELGMCAHTIAFPLTRTQSSYICDNRFADAALGSYWRRPYSALVLEVSVLATSWTLLPLSVIPTRVQRQATPVWRRTKWKVTLQSSVRLVLPYYRSCTTQLTERCTVFQRGPPHMLYALHSSAVYVCCLLLVYLVWDMLKIDRLSRASHWHFWGVCMLIKLFYIVNTYYENIQLLSLSRMWFQYWNSKFSDANTVKIHMKDSAIPTL